MSTKSTDNRGLLAPLALLVLLSVLMTVARVNGVTRASAAPGDVFITALSCDTSPEYVRIKNFSAAAQPLLGFRLQSDPVADQDYDLGAHVSAIAAGQTLEFQSGTGAADNPGAGVYKLTGSFIYRSPGDPTDYARLVRPE